MDDKKNRYIPVTNTSKLIYDLILENIEKIKREAGNRKIVIYGAGARGCLISRLMEESGMTGFCFCDRNPELLDKHINGHTFLPVEELYENHEKYLTVLSPENAQEIINVFEEKGMKAGRDYLSLGGRLYRVFLRELQSCQREGVLVLGDCDLLACSLLEKERDCLGEKLRRRFTERGMPEHYKELSLNAVTFGTFYWSFKANQALGNRADSVFIAVDMRNFNGMNHQLPKTQHTDLLGEMEGIAKIDGFGEYIALSRSRVERGGGGQPAKAQGKGRQSYIANRNYIRMNYCYKWKEENEELRYLCRLLEEIQKDGSQPVLLFLPINYEKAMEYDPQKFEASYKENKRKLLRAVSGYRPYIVDLNFEMDGRCFLVKDTYDECLSNEGREWIADRVWEEYGKAGRSRYEE